MQDYEDSILPPKIMHGTATLQLSGVEELLTRKFNTQGKPCGIP